MDEAALAGLASLDGNPQNQERVWFRCFLQCLLNSAGAADIVKNLSGCAHGWMFPDDISETVWWVVFILHTLNQRV